MQQDIRRVNPKNGKVSGINKDMVKIMIHSEFNRDLTPLVPLVLHQVFERKPILMNSK